MRSRLSSRLLLWLAAFTSFTGLSCSEGGTLNPVTGTVSYQGKPLKGVMVMFHLPGDEPLDFVPPSGQTGDDGSYSITTGETPGAPAGNYVVTFMCSEEVTPPAGKMNMAMGPVFEDRFKGAYAEKTKSEHKIEVKPGPNQLPPFELK